MKNVPALERAWFAGDTKTVDITVYDDDGDTVDVTGATAKFFVYRGEEAVIEKTVSGLNGSTFSVPFIPADTASLGGTSYEVLQYECEVTDAGGNVSTVARGLFRVTADLIP